MTCNSGSSSRSEIDLGPVPSGDGWAWVYRMYGALVRRFPALGRAVRSYFWPKRWELARDSLIYRMLGVGWFGRVIPTGGVLVRRLTGSRMAPYTLKATSLDAARQFFYRTCVFEALHLPFMAALLALSVHRLCIGRADLAIENSVVNLVVNIYPIMHHRHTRARIVGLLRRRAGRGKALTAGPRGS